MAEFIDPNKLELEDTVVSINRITKVVKGGRRLRFAALVVVGDRNGHVGFGTGKAQEVTYGGGKIMLKPAEEGSGVAAGGAVRSVMELAGIDDVTSKRLGSDTPINAIRATFEGLKALKSAEKVATLRGVSAQHLAE